MLGYLTKRPNGTHLLSMETPVRTFIGNTDQEDVYCQPGDALSWGMPVCDFGRRRLFHTEELEVFQCVPVLFTGTQQGPPEILKNYYVKLN